MACDWGKKRKTKNEKRLSLARGHVARPYGTSNTLRLAAAAVCTSARYRVSRNVPRFPPGPIASVCGRRHHGAIRPAFNGRPSFLKYLRCIL